MPRERLVCEDLRTIPGEFDAIIVSEVLEHQLDPDLDALLGAINQKLRSGGRLLITVPNGYGWFELESWLWFKARIGVIIEKLRFPLLMDGVRKVLTGDNAGLQYPSSLETSPHVQRFTIDSIQRRISEAGYKIDDVEGSVMVCGPFSNTFLGGFSSIMRLNNRLGSLFKSRACGFWVAATKL